jgi:4-hydroxy-3-polyprenylbenzoate decarboxylase
MDNRSVTTDDDRLILAVTGATGALAARLLIERSAWPVTLVASRWGRDVAAREGADFDSLAELAAEVLDDADLSAGISSGSVPTAGMVVLPCSADAMAKVAAGVADTLITRSAHCHLKEARKLVLCVRESPWTLIDLQNAARAAAAGAVVMPMSPPFYMFAGREPRDVSMGELLEAYVDRVLAVLGQRPGRTWEHAR